MRVVNIMVGRVFMLLCNFVFISSVMMGQSDDSREGMEDIAKYISMEVISDHASMDSDFIKLDIRNKSPYRIYYGASYHFQKFTGKGWKDVEFSGADIGWEPGLHWLDSQQAVIKKCYLYREYYDYIPGIYRILKQFEYDIPPQKYKVKKYATFILKDDGTVGVFPSEKVSMVKPASSDSIFHVSDSAVEEVYQVVEDMPEYPGGCEELLKLIDDNLQYPDVARKCKIQGRVVVSVVIDEHGSLIKPQIMRSIFPSLDEEALRVVGIISKKLWKPGKQNGTAVKVKYPISVIFKLDD